MPLCPTEAEFQTVRAELACRWSRQCGLNGPWTTATCIDSLSPTTTPDLEAWRECGATYNPCRAGECLAIWRENPVDCTVSFYSGCEAGDWYDGADECPAWYEQ